MKLDDEPEAICRARAGDEEAFARLLARYRPALRHISRRYFLPGGERYDLFQEATIGFWNAIRDYRPETCVSFEHFVDLCVDRQVITAVKTATRLKQGVLNRAVSLDRPIFRDEQDGECFMGRVKAAGESLEEELMRRESVAAMDEAMQSLLSPLERTVVGLYLRQLTYREIAVLCGREPKAVDNALQGVKRKLGRAYQAAAGW